jgi:hypothetical protein
MIDDGRVPRVGWARNAIAVAVLGFGCSETKSAIDTKYLERKIRDSFSDPVESVACPAAIDRNYVECAVKLPRGPTVTARVTFDASSGMASIELLQKVMNVDKFEYEVVHDFTNRNEKVTVECGDDGYRLAKAGDPVTCTATDPSGRVYRIEGTLDDAMTVSWKIVPPD